MQNVKQITGETNSEVFVKTFLEDTGVSITHLIERNKFIKILMKEPIETFKNIDNFENLHLNNQIFVPKNAKNVKFFQILLLRRSKTQQKLVIYDIK